MSQLHYESGDFEVTAIIDQPTVNKALPEWYLLGEAKVVTLGSPTVLFPNPHLMQPGQDGRFGEANLFRDLGC